MDEEKGDVPLLGVEIANRESSNLPNASTSSQTRATRVAKGFECSGTPFVQDDWERVDRVFAASIGVLLITPQTMQRFR
jgi:hypothetical protein